jgi:hypothetical protein
MPWRLQPDPGAEASQVPDGDAIFSPCHSCSFNLNTKSQPKTLILQKQICPNTVHFGLLCDLSVADPDVILSEAKNPLLHSALQADALLRSE